MRYSFLSGLVAAIGLSLIVLPACSSNSAQLTSLERRIAAVEDEQHNFQAKQESLNTWEAGRLSRIEAKHPDIEVPPPPQYMVRESVPATSPVNPLQGGVVETNPGLARVEPAAAGTAPAAAQPALQANAQSMRVYPAPLPGAGSTPAAPAAGQSPAAASGGNTPSPTQTAQPAVTPAETAKAAPASAEQVAAQPAASTPATASGGRVINPNAAPAPLKPTPTAQTNEPPQTNQPKAAPSDSASAQPSRTSGEKGEYASALRLVERGRNAEGRAALDKFMSKYPSSTLMPNAIYWKGETYYGEQNYQEAVLAFRDVTTRFPKTAKAADALLKIGMSYQKMGDSQNAKFYLEQLTNEFPNTRAANLAKQQLTKIP